ncbi:MAG: arginine--tRNA ligase [Rickettsiaceae bacterium]
MNIFKILKEDVCKSASKLSAKDDLLSNIVIEIPKNSLNGDVSTNAAMLLASELKSNPNQLAIRLKNDLSKLPYVAHIEIANPGFINFTLKSEIWHSYIKQILSDKKDFSSIELDIDIQHKVNIEYVSANPTGPLHIGHARCAVYGDVLARLLKKCNYDSVVKEYYINDAGAQIQDLISTVMLRYQEIVTGVKAVIPNNLYPGEYLVEVARALVDKHSDNLNKISKDQANAIVKDFTIDTMMKSIKLDLNKLGVHHEVFVSEQELHDSNKLNAAIKDITKLGLVYTGKLPAPKGKGNENWDSRNQLLFKSTEFGDDQDRPLQKSDNSWTYFASDIAYMYDKIERGFDYVIYILGADHSGYVERIKAITKAISKGKVSCDIKICQLVNIIRNGSVEKMSKRIGNFITLDSVLEEVDKDALRFMMLTRKNDSVIDFDLDLIKEQSKDNPVFYVQYAYVRTVSILSKAKETAQEAYHKFINDQYDLELLSSEDEIGLIKSLASWQKILESAAKYFEPHRIAFYLMNLAATFHSLWNLGKESNDYRFIVQDDDDLTSARLALVMAVQKTMFSGFEIIGVNPVEKM